MSSDGFMAVQMSVLIVFLLPLPAALVGPGVLFAVRNSRISAQINQVSEECQKSFRGWFPSRYLTSEDVGACWRLVSNHRASTVENAINEYKTQLHRQRLDDYAAAQVAEQQRSTRITALGNIIHAAGHGATVGANRAEGQAAAVRAPNGPFL